MKKYEFPLYIHAIKFIRSALVKLRIDENSRISVLFTAKLYKQVFSFMRKEYSHIIEKYNSQIHNSQSNINQSDALPDEHKHIGYIWTCWWQGEDNAPPLVKRCLESIRKNAGNHRVVVIDKQNISQYINFPEHIIDKFEAGLMPAALLCDSVRVTLLAQHGGLWLDATIFCFKPIPEDIFNMPLFNTNPESDVEKLNELMVAGKDKEHWLAPYTPFTTVSVLGGSKNHLMFRFTRDVLEQYWSKYSTLMIYNLFSCVMKLACNTFDSVKHDADAIPSNDQGRYKLRRLFKTAHKYNWDIVNELANSDTHFYKMTWKLNYAEYTDSGEETMYKRFIEGTMA